jgi:hypothetical protein
LIKATTSDMNRVMLIPMMTVCIILGAAPFDNDVNIEGYQNGVSLQEAKEGVTALQHARLKGFTEIARILASK